jgi:hypothetical protein
MWYEQERTACVGECRRDGGPLLPPRPTSIILHGIPHCQRKFTNIFGVVDTSMSNTVMQLYT